MFEIKDLEFMEDPHTGYLVCRTKLGRYVIYPDNDLVFFAVKPKYNMEFRECENPEQKANEHWRSVIGGFLREVNSEG